MPLTNTENQRSFKERMYAAGYKQCQVWVPREGKKPAKMNRNAFLRKMDALTVFFSKKELGKLYNELIKTIQAKKEELETKRR